jgi:excisionase family DNA binding protein
VNRSSSIALPELSQVSKRRPLTRQQAADYLNLSSDMLDRLTQQGELPRVQLALGNRNVRKVLYDRADLDRLVELSRVV